MVLNILFWLVVMRTVDCFGADHLLIQFACLCCVRHRVKCARYAVLCSVWSDSVNARVNFYPTFSRLLKPTADCDSLIRQYKRRVRFSRYVCNALLIQNFVCSCSFIEYFFELHLMRLRGRIRISNWVGVHIPHKVSSTRFSSINIFIYSPVCVHIYT